MSYDWKDNSHVLTWLVDVLSAAESAGEKVHILSHIPPGNHDCLGAWGKPIYFTFCKNYADAQICIYLRSIKRTLKKTQENLNQSNVTF